MFKSTSIPSIFRFCNTKSYYETFSVYRTAEQPLIRKNFLKMVNKHHVDKNPTPYSLRIFKQISSAYKILQNPSLRKDYDNKNSNTNSFNFKLNDYLTRTVKIGFKLFVAYFLILQIGHFIMFLSNYASKRQNAEAARAQKEKNRLQNGELENWYSVQIKYQYK